MSGDEDGGIRRSAIPLTAGAIVLAQFTMSIATWLGNRLTLQGIGRKPLFLAGLLSLPVRCALVIYWKDAGDSFLLSTQILDGIGGGLFGLVHPYLIADITFGTGRFNVLSTYLCRLFLYSLFLFSGICLPTNYPSAIFLFRSGCYAFIVWNGSDPFQLYWPTAS